MDCGHGSLHDAKAVMDDLGQGAKQWVVQEALRHSATLFMELSYLLWFTPVTNTGPSAEGAEMMPLVTPAFR